MAANDVSADDAVAATVARWPDGWADAIVESEVRRRGIAR
jgi:hypothetical protein